MRKYNPMLAVAALAAVAVAVGGCDRDHSRNNPGTGTNSVHKPMPGTTAAPGAGNAAGGIDGTDRNGAGHGTLGGGPNGSGIPQTEDTTSARRRSPATGVGPTSKPVGTSPYGNQNGGAGPAGSGQQPQ